MAHQRMKGLPSAQNQGYVNIRKAEQKLSKIVLQQLS